MSSFYETLDIYLTCACGVHICIDYISMSLKAMSIIVKENEFRLLEKGWGPVITQTSSISTSILYINIY